MLHLGIIAHAAQQIVRDARRAAAAPGDLAGALLIDLHVQQPRGADDDFLQLLGLVIVQSLANRETG